MTVWKVKYDCEQAWTRLQQISEMTEVKKQEEKSVNIMKKALFMLIALVLIALVLIIQ